MDIYKLSYIDFVSLIKEENRPPGGKKTIRMFLQNSFMNKNSKILEVGCTNGFTSLEVARLLNCKVWGIDVHKDSVENARSRVKKEKVKFQVANAEKLPFKSDFFDMLIASNATSFMENKDQAINEYFRVVKPWGFVATCPMYYLKSPSSKLIKEVSNVLGFNIEARVKEDWISMFNKKGFEIYFSEDYTFDYRAKKDIMNLVNETIKKPHLLKFNEETKGQIKNRWEKILSIFNKNLSYMGYSSILLRKRNEKEEIELFTTSRIK